MKMGRIGVRAIRHIRSLRRLGFEVVYPARPTQQETRE